MLEFNEIQGLVVSGYRKQKASCSLLLNVIDAQAAVAWLAPLIPSISFADDKNPPSRLNLAFTYSGLGALRCPESILSTFSQEFTEGIVSDHRQRVLGDLPSSSSDPLGWHWGGPTTEPIHILLMLYEIDEATLKRRLNETRDGLRGVQIVEELHSALLQKGKEHFGFRDGISQPIMRTDNCPDGEKIAPGEFVLGYPNEAGDTYPDAFLRNGTYLVFRQIEQDVEGFWSNLRFNTSDSDAIFKAAKMVGRWPDGTPLTLSPDKPDGTLPINDFGFAKKDSLGEKCPFGAHIRRSNPRDGLVEDPADSLHAVRHHRILRRGRTYGAPAAEAALPSAIKVALENGASDIDHNATRGLFFICLNGDISRQFEFIQQAWINNPKFGGQYEETDPIASTVEWSHACPGTFTIQANPLRRRLTKLRKYISTVGGAYFFLPGKTALEQICSDSSADT